MKKKYTIKTIIAFAILLSTIPLLTSCGPYKVMEEKGVIELGMKPEQVKEIWGTPSMTVEYETALNGHVTAWMYIQMFKYTSQTVHFKNGVVVNFMYEMDSRENN